MECKNVPQEECRQVIDTKCQQVPRQKCQQAKKSKCQQICEPVYWCKVCQLWLNNIFFLYKIKTICAIFVLQNFIYVDKIHFKSTRWPKTPKNMSSYKYICCLLMNITNLCITYNFVKFLSKSCNSNIVMSMRQYLIVDD